MSETGPRIASVVRFLNSPQLQARAEEFWQTQPPLKRSGLKGRSTTAAVVQSLRSRLRCALKATGARKADRTIRLIGCTAANLCDHIQRQFKHGMSWANYGDWHIDHKKPCCAFNLHSQAEQRTCFHYTNLQPLWARDNLSKGGRY